MPSRPAIVSFTVEPFVEGKPGVYVTAAIDAANRAGLSVEMDPFSNNGFGDVSQIWQAWTRLACPRCAITFAAGKATKKCG